MRYEKEDVPTWEELKEALRPLGSYKVAKTRTEAINLGLSTYFTGEPCQRGHVAPRTVSNGKCKGCVEQELKALRDRRRG
ncbi:MAG: hypothetical protein VW739_04315, partial [Pelagibacteraceae bacterium]